MYQGTGPGFLEWVWAAHTAMMGHSHQITNVLIDVDGRPAPPAARPTSLRRCGARSNRRPATEIVSRGRYVDRWSRRDGRWAIDHRRFVEDFTVTTSVTGATPPDPTASPARRDRTTPRTTRSKLTPGGPGPERSQARAATMRSPLGESEPPSSSGLGRRPFKAVTGIRTPLGARSHRDAGDRHWSCGAVWSARRPVKAEAAGSNPVRTADEAPAVVRPAG